MLCGISGSGKTTFARVLEKKGYTRLSLDAIVWNNYGELNKDMPLSERQKIFALANQEMDRQLKKHLDEGISIVIDATMCKRMRRDAIREICKPYGIVPKLVFLQAEERILSKRLSNRKGTGPDDQIVSPEDLHSFCKNFQTPDNDELCEYLEST